MASRSVDGGGAVLAAAGVVCALGYDPATAMAAARAQLSRAAVQQHFRMRSDVEGVEEPVVGHGADLLTLGFELPVRLQRLAQGALAQLCAGETAAAISGRRVGVYGAVPSAQAAASEGDEAAPDQAAAADLLLRRALLGAQWPAAPGRRSCVVQGGRTAGVWALATAARDLSAGTVDAAVVVAADSLLDETTLQQLHTQGRLKCDGAPAGLVPGEGGVALLLLRGADPALPPGPHASVQALSVDEEPRAFAAGHSSTGEALARALAAAAERRAGGRAWLLSDHNGEHYRANDWGCAWARLRALDEAFADCEVWYPALSFGDTGAAGPLLSMAMVQQAHLRGYAPARTALICSAGDGPERGAVLLQLH